MFRTELWTPSLHDPITPLIKHELLVTKSLKHDNIHNLKLYVKQEHTCRILTS